MEPDGVSPAGCGLAGAKGAKRNRTHGLFKGNQELGEVIMPISSTSNLPSFQIHLVQDQKDRGVGGFG